MTSYTMKDVCFQFSLFMRDETADPSWVELVEELEGILNQEDSCLLSEWAEVNHERMLHRVIHPVILGYVRRPYLSALLESLKKSTQIGAKNVSSCPEHWNPFDWRLVSEFLTLTQLFVAENGRGRMKWMSMNEQFKDEFNALGLSNIVGKNLEAETVMQTLRVSLVLAMILSENPIRCMQIYLEVKGRSLDFQATDEDLILKSIEVYFKAQHRTLKVILEYLSFLRRDNDELCQQVFWAENSFLKCCNCSCLMHALTEAAEICLHRSIEGNECIPERHLQQLQSEILSELCELCKLLPLGAEGHRLTGDDVAVLESLAALYMKTSCITFSEVSGMEQDVHVSGSRGVDYGRNLLMTGYRLHTSTCSCSLANVLTMLICGADADLSPDVRGSEGESIFHDLVEILHSSRFEEMSSQYNSSGREGFFLAETLKWSPTLLLQHLGLLASFRLARSNSAEAFNHALASCLNGSLHHLALILDLPALSRWPDVKDELGKHNANIVSFAIDVLEHHAVTSITRDDNVNGSGYKNFDHELAVWSSSVESCLSCIRSLAADPQVAFHLAANDHIGKLLAMVQRALKLTESDLSGEAPYNHRDHKMLFPSLRLASSFFHLFSTVLESIDSVAADEDSASLCFQRLLSRLNQAIRLFRGSPPLAFSFLQDYCRLSASYMSFPSSQAETVEHKKYYHSQLKSQLLENSDLHTSGSCFHALFQSHFAVLTVEKKELLQQQLSLYESALIDYFSSLLQLIRTCCPRLTPDRLKSLNSDLHMYSSEMLLPHLDFLLSTWTEPVSSKIKTQVVLLMKELVLPLRGDASELASFVRKLFRLMYAPVVDLDHGAMGGKPADVTSSMFNMFYVEFLVMDRASRKYGHTIAMLQLVSSLLPSFPAEVSRRFLADCYPIMQLATESQSAENFLDPKEKWQILNELMRMGSLCLLPHVMRDDLNHLEHLTRTMLDRSVFASSAKRFATGSSADPRLDVRKLIHWMIHPNMSEETAAGTGELKGLVEVAVELVGRGLEHAQRQEETIALPELSHALQSCTELLIVSFQLCADQCGPEEADTVLDHVCWSWTGTNEKLSRRKVPSTLLEYAVLEDEPELAALALELLLVIITSSKNPVTRDVVLAEIFLLDTELAEQARISHGLCCWFERAQASSDELSVAICSRILRLLLASLRTLEDREEESPSLALALLQCANSSGSLFTTITRRSSLQWPSADEMAGEEALLMQVDSLRRVKKCSELAAMTSELMYHLVRSPWVVEILRGSLEEEMSLLLEHLASDFPYFELIKSIRDRVSFLRSGNWLLENGFAEPQVQDFDGGMLTWGEEEAFTRWLSRYPRDESLVQLLVAGRRRIQELEGVLGDLVNCQIHFCHKTGWMLRCLADCISHKHINLHDDKFYLMLSSFIGSKARASSPDKFHFNWRSGSLHHLLDNLTKLHGVEEEVDTQSLDLHPLLAASEAKDCLVPCDSWTSDMTFFSSNAVKLRLSWKLANMGRRSQGEQEALNVEAFVQHKLCSPLNGLNVLMRCQSARQHFLCSLRDFSRTLADHVEVLHDAGYCPELAMAAVEEKFSFFFHLLSRHVIPAFPARLSASNVEVTVHLSFLLEHGVSFLVAQRSQRVESAEQEGMSETVGRWRQKLMLLLDSVLGLLLFTRGSSDGGMEEGGSVGSRMIRHRLYSACLQLLAHLKLDLFEAIGSREQRDGLIRRNLQARSGNSSTSFLLFRPREVEALLDSRRQPLLDLTLRDFINFDEQPRSWDPSWECRTLALRLLLHLLPSGNTALHSRFAPSKGSLLPDLSSFLQRSHLIRHCLDDLEGRTSLPSLLDPSSHEKFAGHLNVFTAKVQLLKQLSSSEAGLRELTRNGILHKLGLCSFLSSRIFSREQASALLFPPSGQTSRVSKNLLALSFLSFSLVASLLRIPASSMPELLAGRATQSERMEEEEEEEEETAPAKMEESILKFIWNHRALMQAICSPPHERASWQQALVPLNGSTMKRMKVEATERHRCVLADLFLSANRLRVLESDAPNPGPLGAQVKEEVKQYVIAMLDHLLEEKTIRTLPWAGGEEEDEEEEKEEVWAVEDVDLLPPQAVKDLKLETLRRCLSFLLQRVGPQGGGGELMVDSSEEHTSSRCFLPAVRLVDFLGLCVDYLCGKEEGRGGQEEDGEGGNGAWGELCRRWQRLLDRKVSASRDGNLRLQDRDFSYFREHVEKVCKVTEDALELMVRSFHLEVGGEEQRSSRRNSLVLASRIWNPDGKGYAQRFLKFCQQRHQEQSMQCNWPRVQEANERLRDLQEGRERR